MGNYRIDGTRLPAGDSAALLQSLSEMVGGGKSAYLLTPQRAVGKLQKNESAQAPDGALWVDSDATEWEQAICYMLPHRLGGLLWGETVPQMWRDSVEMLFENMCVHSTQGCRGACLHTAGRLAMAERAKLARTALYANTGATTDGAPSLFWSQMAAEVRRNLARVERQGKRLCVRINGTSDIDVPLWLTEQFPSVVFTDYSKRQDLQMGWARPNLYRVLSATENTTDAEIHAEIAAGRNVVVPFTVRRGSDLPQTYLGHRVIDGDKHDLRFRDPQGVIVGLRYKLPRGYKNIDHKGFIRNPSAEVAVTFA